MKLLHEEDELVVGKRDREHAENDGRGAGCGDGGGDAINGPGKADSKRRRKEAKAKKKSGAAVVAGSMINGDAEPGRSTIATNGVAGAVVDLTLNPKSQVGNTND